MTRDPRFAIPLDDGLRYPGHGYPENPGQDRPGGSPFGRLAKNQPLGQTTTLIFNAAELDPQYSGQEILRVEGDDLDAQQMVITLAPPRVIPLAFVDIPIDIETSPTASESNSEVTSDDFPGGDEPVAWPPLQAIIEWGTRGMQARAVVDYVNGVTFSVTGSFVRVLAVIAQGANVDVESTSAAYQVGGFIGPGFGKQNGARNTMYIGELANGTESDTFAVPKFATRATLVSCDPSSAPAATAGTIRFWRTPDGVSGGHNAGNFVVGSNIPPVDIPNGGLYFSVISNMSLAPVLCAVVFELAIG